MNINDFMPGGFRLRQGAGGGDPKDGLCYMETVSLIAGEKITDRPACACPVITQYGIRLNDDFENEDRQRLLPLVWATAGTRSEKHEQERREILCRAAVDLAELVLPIFEERYPDDNRPRLAIEAAKAFWENPNEPNAAAYAATYAAARAAAAAAARAAAATATAARAAAAAAAHASDATRAYAATNHSPEIRAKVVDRTIKALRDAIEAGPNGGIPADEFVPRIEAVRDALPVNA